MKFRQMRCQNGLLDRSGYRINSWMFLVLWVLSGCASSESVRQKSLEYLEGRYRESFLVSSIDMQRNEGNWGVALLEVSPQRIPELRFRLNYNYSRDQVIYEDYLLELWGFLLLEKLKASHVTIMDRATVMDFKLARKGSGAVNTRDFPVQKDLNGLSLLEEPTGILALDLTGPVDRSTLLLLSEILRSLRNQGLQKACLDINFTGSDGPGSLRVQSYGKHGIPGPAELQRLLQKEGEPTAFALSQRDYDRALKLMGAAGELQSQQSKREALRIFESIVQKYDSPFRWDPYVVAQSANVYESMYRAGLLHQELGNPQKARFYLGLLEDRLSFVEAPLKYYTMRQEMRKQIAR
ncbi:MAG: hypothetical protein KDK23_03490 [Leptospiraceae bacterium]|nr:hypothetical protein [Leptospiraceae bacterium]